jgi:site-specific DNA-methyltransferase (adenine-specific)
MAEEAIMSEGEISKQSGADGVMGVAEGMPEESARSRPLRPGTGNKLVGLQRVLREDARWTITQGDSLKLLRSLPDASVDAVITDPPYSSGSQFTAGRAGQPPSKKYGLWDVTKKRPDFQGDNRDQRSFMIWCSLWLAECLRASKPGAPLVVFTDWRQLPTVTDAIQVAGWVWRGVAVWDKTEGTRPQMGRFRSQCEYMVWGTNGPSIRRDDQTIGVLPGCFRHFSRQHDRFHLTGKPTPLMVDVVRICKPGGIVLDPFAGSGTTIVAALSTSRRGIGLELSEEYATIARGRCRAAVPGEETPKADA